MNTIPITDPQNKTPILNSLDWRRAVNDILAFWIGKGRPFSSGEVAAALRIHRPDLKFAVQTLGEYIKEEFYAQNLPKYPDDGTGQQAYPYQVPRMTQGKFPMRTPANAEVFVYAANPGDGDAHDFEIYVPEPGEAIGNFPQAQPVAPATQTPVAILGAKVANIDITAKVHDDGRLCVPRSAFELCVHLGGQPMQGGDPVFVKIETDKAVITLAQTDPTAKRYDLSVERGRVLFPSPDPMKVFVPGDAYRVKVEAGVLTVDLTQKA